MSKIRGIVLLLCIIVVMLILSLYLGFSCKEGATTATPVPAGSRPAATSTSTSTSTSPVTDCKKSVQKFKGCGNGNGDCNITDFKNIILKKDDAVKSAGIDIDNDECYKNFKANPTKKDNFFVSPNECECNSFGNKCTTKAIRPDSNASFNVCYTKK